jgi:hypothetical protein
MQVDRELEKPQLALETCKHFYPGKERGVRDLPRVFSTNLDVVASLLIFLSLHWA